MQNTLSRGVYTVVVTPFLENNKVDYDSISRIITNQINKGISGLVLLGTTSESPTLSMVEKLEIVKFVSTYYGGKFEIIVGIGGNNTVETINFGKMIKNQVNGFMVTVPNYNKPSQLGIYNHFTTIANTFSDVPIMMYNIPSRCGVNMTPDTVKNIYYNCENVVAIKEASGSLEQAIKIKSLCDINIFSGDDSLILPILAIGGVGVISVASNILPWEISYIVSQFNNNIDLSRKLYFKFHNFIKALFVTTNPVPVKYFLSKLELINNDIVRLPLVKCPKLEITMKSIEDFLKECQKEKHLGGKVEHITCPMVI